MNMPQYECTYGQSRITCGAMLSNFRAFSRVAYSPILVSNRAQKPTFPSASISYPTVNY